jgi:hypothetical protein
MQKELATRLTEFLKSPSADLAKGKAAPSKKRKSTGTKTAAKSSKTKSAVSIMCARVCACAY